MEPVVEVQNADKYYGELEVLRGIDLRIERGAFVSIVGASGCGKTTLLRMIDGLIRPTRGAVYIGGEKVVRPSLSAGFVFQNDSLLPWRNLMDNVLVGLEIRKTNKEEARARASELIELVGLKGFERYYPLEISGGMRQRTNLARALAIDPDVLLMDEPFAALDAQTRELMQAELLRIWNETKKTVLFVTHQIDEAVFLSDRVVVLSAHPGMVRETVSIDLPRPRSLSMKREPAFLDYLDRVWKLIEADVETSIGGATGP